MIETQQMAAGGFQATEQLVRNDSSHDINQKMLRR